MNEIHTETLENKLIDIVGDKGLISTEDDLIQYAKPTIGYGEKPLCIVKP